MYRDEEWEDCSDMTQSQADNCDECEFVIKYCCIDFKKDCWKGTCRSLALAFLKLIGIIITIFIVLYVLFKIKRDQKESVLMEYLLTTSTTPMPPVYLNWSDLKSRPMPSWYDKAKIGINVHWGLYSVPGYGPNSENFWYNANFDHKCRKFVKQTYGSTFNYQNLAHEFTAESFNPDYWAKLFVNSGAKYVIFTSKEIDGYAMFPSDQSIGWDCVGNGPRRDLLYELAVAVRRYGLRFGIQYTTSDWFNPLLMFDRSQNYSLHKFALEKVWPDLMKITSSYNPSLVYINEALELYDDFDIQHFLPWLYNFSFGKWEIITAFSYGGLDRSLFGSFDFPRAWKPGYNVLRTKFEKVIKLDKESLGFRHNLELSDVVTTKEMLLSIIEEIANGKNVAINIGPTKEGTIPLIYQKRLLELGNWLRTNGEAVYETMPWKEPLDVINGQAFYTCTVTQVLRYGNPLALEWMTTATEDNYPYAVSSLYVIFLKWPYNGRLRLRYVAHLFVNGMHQVEFLEQPSKYWNWTIFENGLFKEIEIQLPKRVTVISHHAWVLRITPKPTDSYHDENVGNKTRQTNNRTKDHPKKVPSIKDSHNHTLPNIHTYIEKVNHSEDNVKEANFIKTSENASEVNRDTLNASKKYDEEMDNNKKNPNIIKG